MPNLIDVIRMIRLNGASALEWSETTLANAYEGWEHISVSLTSAVQTEIAVMPATGVCKFLLVTCPVAFTMRINLVGNPLITCDTSVLLIGSGLETMLVGKPDSLWLTQSSGSLKTAEIWVGYDATP